ncbi:SNF2-related protein [soil metagenome]
MAVSVSTEITDYHAKLFAYQLSRRYTGESADKLATSLIDAVVEINPHQIDAALFAFQSPLSQGVILADEVGLGKTIEAGLVISQVWAERKRSILIITPVSLRKQWMAELEEKFHLPSTIIERSAFDRERKERPRANPFDRNGKELVIVSTDYAVKREEEIERIPWDLVVIDEAHNLRNSAGKKAQSINRSTKGRKKLLLTATPLQNNLNELWGLASLIDEHFFGDRAAFQKRYGGHLDQHAFEELRARLKPLVQRTLRRDASTFIKFTKRMPLLEVFTPTEDEKEIYKLVTEYLQRDQLLALPSGQRHLMTMVLRKLLASSTFSIAGALRKMANRLERDLKGLAVPAIEDELEDEYESIHEDAEEWEADDEIVPEEQIVTREQRQALESEMNELKALAEMAEQIAHNAKASALVSGLRKAFAAGAEKGAPRKAIIFTQFRRTQDYLERVLSAETDLAEGLVLFNGSNTDDRSKAIYSAWLAKNAGTDRVTGSRDVDRRTAIVDYFRTTGEVMIATEAAAEGINLQFCPLVINYDLPWNPQRVEQRIGRCHRYGQLNDVAVLNFLDEENEADRRVYELLKDKFHLFEGVFGATDEVLGSIGSGVNIEQRIADIYQTARSRDDINEKFDQMQFDLSDQIDERRSSTERKLFEHFDQNVAERFQRRGDSVRQSLRGFERSLMGLTRHELRDHASFESERSFVLRENPFRDIEVRTGRYDLITGDERKFGEMPDLPEHLYRLGHPLSQRLIDTAKARALPSAEVIFQYSARAGSGRQAGIEEFIGSSGWISASLLSLEMEAGAEDHLLLAGFADDGRVLESDQIERLFRIPGRPGRLIILDPSTEQRLREREQQEQSATQAQLEDRFISWMAQEEAKLDGWAKDRKENLLGDIEKLEREIDALEREGRVNPGDLRNRHERSRLKADLERRRDDLEDRNRERRREIDRERKALLDKVSDQLDQTAAITPLFTIRWRLEE